MRISSAIPAIAIGLGLLFGYRLPINFNLPYISGSFSEFWTRWHISLSNWLRTYLYIPLGGNRHGALRTYLNLMIVMGLGGLWHGAGLGYLTWGLMHGLLLVIERPLLTRARSRSTRRCFARSRMSFVFYLRHHALDFLQAAEFRPCGQLSVRHVHAEHESEPAEAVLQSGIALFAAGHHPASCVRSLFERTLRRAEPYLYGAMAALMYLEAGPETSFIYFQF